MDSSSLTALAAAVLRVPRRPERVLEVGCGEGDRTLFLAREFPAARVRGVDPSADSVRAAIARTGLDPEGRVAFKQGRSRGLPYPDGLFELVVQAEGRLRPGELARVLRPQGHLIVIGDRRWIEWRLGAAGFDPREGGAVGGERFHVFRLHAAEPRPE